VDVARAREEQALLQYQSAVAQGFREVADALAARRGYSDFLKSEEEQVSALRQASARVLRRYEAGYSSYFEVIDADSTLYAAELQLVQAYRNNLLSLVQLYKALGGGWNESEAIRK
jgi:multidrug efflux system outer membrane protein